MLTVGTPTYLSMPETSVCLCFMQKNQSLQKCFIIIISIIAFWH